MKIHAMILTFCTLLISVKMIRAADHSQDNEARRVDAMGREYFLYLPEHLDPDKIYWLVVGIHGAKQNGKGAGGYADWAGREDCIVVGPSFPDGYQGLEHQTDRQLLGIREELSKKIKLHKQMFLAGFSGGAQFAHRFALANPQDVIGCAAHSGGTWASGDIRGDITDYKAAANVPFVISCGQLDNAVAFPNAPFSRIDWAHRFEKVLKDNNFYFKAQYWPGLGHRRSENSNKLSLECFHLSITGMHEQERQAVDALLNQIESAAKSRDYQVARAELDSFKNDLATVKTRLEKDKPGIEEKAFWHLNEKTRAELSARARQHISNRCDAINALISAAVNDKNPPSHRK